MTRKNILSTVLGLTGAIFGSMVGYCGSVRATEARLEYMRLSAAYEGYVSSLAQSISAADLYGMIEARANVMLYGDHEVLAKLAAGRLPCEDDWFLNVIEDLRPRIGQARIRQGDGPKCSLRREATDGELRGRPGNA